MKKITLLILFIYFFSVNLLIGQNNSLVRIVSVGDINLGTSYPSDDYLPSLKEAPYFLLKQANGLISSANFAFCNLEGAFLNSGIVAKRCKDSTNCFVFKTPTSYFKCLVDAGFDLFSLANNHINDFGQAGVDTTYRLIDKYKLAGAGTPNRSFTVFEKDGIKIGFCAFSPYGESNNMNNYSRVKAIISELDSISDIVFVSFHGGAEGRDHQHINKQREFFLGEDRGDVLEFSKIAIDAGADIIIGSGPHIPRAVFLYKDRFIAFSLGNFCTYSRININGVNGYAPLLDIQVTKDGRFVDGKIHSFIQVSRAGVVIDSLNRTSLLMKKLTFEDFPDTQLEINNDGKIQKIQ